MLEFYTGHFWIAASAVGMPLITLNRRHFEPLTLHGLALL
jgi:predicted nucleic acid-binding protein